MPAQAAEFELRFGTLAPDGTPWSDVLMDFKKRIEKDTGGRVEVKVYLNGVLGDERAMLQKMRYNQLTGGGFSTGGISSVVPELQILELPFLFQDDSEADFVMDLVIRPELEAALEAKGLKLFIWAVNGWLDFGAPRVLHSPADLQGCKVAMQESTVQLSMYEAMQVKPTPLPVPEILGALQTGMVDTYSGSPVFSTAAQWFAHTKTWGDTNHIYQPAAVVFTTKFWQSLPADIQQIVLGYQTPLQAEARRAVRGLDDELLQGFKENGIQLWSWTPAERDAFRLAAGPSHADMVKRGAFTQALLDKVYAALKKRRSG
jgi:TRAP-type C4-dicarboxylate transport system substrate-binding protein